MADRELACRVGMDPIRAIAATAAAVSSPDCRCIFNQGKLVGLCVLCQATADTIEPMLRKAVVGELVALSQWMDASLDLGADRSQIADPVILARRDIHAHIVARIAELRGSK